jgi:predicted nuclease of predicted toxin-antitoxin system
MRLLVDACIDVRVAEWLKSLGHDPLHLRDEGLQRLPDVAVFDKAIAESRVILTADLDFAQIAAFSRGREVGVILMRLRDTRADHVIDRLAAVLPACQRALARPAVVTVEESRYRVRRLPIGVD